MSLIMVTETGVMKVAGFLKLLSPIAMKMMREDIKIILAN